MAEKYLCRDCSKPVTVTKLRRYRAHTDGTGDPCKASGEQVPQDLRPAADGAHPDVPAEGEDFAVCGDCGRNVKLTRNGYFEDHTATLRGADRCPNGGVRYRPGVPEDNPLPGDELPEAGVYTAVHPRVSAQMEVERAATSEPARETPPAEAAAPVSEDASLTLRQNLERTPMAESAPGASSGVSTESSSPESATTSTLSKEPGSTPGSSPPSPSPSSSGPFRLGPKLSETFLQPGSPFLQPPEWLGVEKPEPMGDFAQELATRIKETFYGYSNRKTADNRGAQITLGPSEIGTPCDRRLAMSLMGVPAVNPGGDGWASFVGTCGHSGMAEVYNFANAGTGRYEVEFPVYPGVAAVPHGTADCLDRRDGTLIDWKFLGVYSLKKFKLEGPPPTYRLQGHVYGLAAERAGEKVKNIAIVGLPRAGSSLDEMHVWTEKYDRKFAQAGLDRVQFIADEAEKATKYGHPYLAAAREFPTADDCRYCPFHLKNDKEMIRGCPGS